MEIVELSIGIVWAVNYGRISVSASSFGLMKNALNAKQMNTMPPIIVTVKQTKDRSVNFVNNFCFFIVKSVKDFPTSSHRYPLGNHSTANDS